jgi:hypothetical protein
MSSPGIEPNTLACAYKRALFGEGFAILMGEMDDGQPVLVISKKSDKDVLQNTLEDWIREEGKIDAADEEPEDGTVIIKNIKVKDLEPGIGIVNCVEEYIPKGVVFDVEISDNHFEFMRHLSRVGFTNSQKAVDYANKMFDERSNDNIYEGRKGRYVGSVIISAYYDGETRMVYGLTI